MQNQINQLAAYPQEIATNSEIAERLNALENSSKILFSVIDELEIKISSTLLDQVPSGSGNTGAAPEPMRSGLATGLHCLNNSFQQAIERINSMRQRCQL